MLTYTYIIKRKIPQPFLKVKGHLQLYVAYVHDGSEPPSDENEPEQAGEPRNWLNGSVQRVPTRATEEDWEIVGELFCAFL